MDEMKVKEVMLPLSEYATVSGERTIQDALRALDKAQLGLTNDRHHHRAVLVLDKKKRVIGKLSHWAILRRLETHLLGSVKPSLLAEGSLTSGDLGRLEEDLAGFSTGLSALCKRAAKIKAKDAMVPISESIDENEPLGVAIHQLVVSHAQSLLVTRDCVTIGILRLSDVFKVVADKIREE